MLDANLRELLKRLTAFYRRSVPVPAPLRSTHDPSGGSESNRIRPRLTQNTRLFNLLGLPSISVPCGFAQVEDSGSAEGLPVGLQISGPLWSEPMLLQVAHAYERATPWHTRVVNRETFSMDD